jgi:hypothetical protein
MGQRTARRPRSARATPSASCGDTSAGTHPGAGAGPVGCASVEVMLRTIGVPVTALALFGAAVALASTPTKLEEWAAFTNGKLAAGIHVVETARGSCSGGSHVDARSDAWYCLAQGQAQDPCFAGPAAFMICPFGTPDSHDALKLKLARPLPTGNGNPHLDPTRRDPWAVLTADGAYCYRTTGPPSRIAGGAISYQCAGAALLAGHPNRAQAVWTINLLPTQTSTRYRTVAIETAWW